MGIFLWGNDIIFGEGFPNTYLPVFISAISTKTLPTLRCKLPASTVSKAHPIIPRILVKKLAQPALRWLGLWPSLEMPRPPNAKFLLEEPWRHQTWRLQQRPLLPQYVPVFKYAFSIEFSVVDSTSTFSPVTMEAIPSNIGSCHFDYHCCWKRCILLCNAKRPPPRTSVTVWPREENGGCARKWMGCHQFAQNLGHGRLQRCE